MTPLKEILALAEQALSHYATLSLVHKDVRTYDYQQVAREALKKIEELKKSLDFSK